MINYKHRRAYDLRCHAEAIEKSEETVTVELTLPVAWLLRDLIGKGASLSLFNVNTNDDLMALNKAVGCRPTAPQGDLPAPHVSGWAEKKIQGLLNR